MRVDATPLERAAWFAGTESELQKTRAESKGETRA
jgi:hypothetical protein